jgi:hypothetical protein
MKNLIVRTLVVGLLLTCGSPPGNGNFAKSRRADSHQQDSQEKQTGEQEVEILRQERVGADAVAPQIKQLTASKQGQALVSVLGQNGFRAKTGKEDYFGWEVEYRNKDGKSLKSKLILQDYAKPRSKDIAALASITLTAGGQTSTYEFVLIAPNGDVQKPQEYKVNENLKAEIAQSLWTCFLARVRSRCTGVCIGALLTCPTSSWTAYLGCLALRCGGCAATAFACCSCNSRLWCRWGVGSCHQ